MIGRIDDIVFWDRIARKYANAPIRDMAGYERTLDRVRSLLTPTCAVLELGCGTGTTALRLAPDVGRIVATDASREMIEIAKERAVVAGCQNAAFAVAKAGHVEAPDASFDAVLAFNLLHLVPDRGAAFRRIRRLLKPGGLFISKTPALSEMNRMIRWAVPVMRLVGKAPSVGFFSGAELEGEIEHAGFAIVERARHGSGRKDPRAFIVARKTEA